MNKKNIIIIGIVLLLAAGAWAASSFLLNSRSPVEPETVSTEEQVQTEEESIVATSTEAVAENTATATSTKPSTYVPKAPARLAIDKTLFNYDIVAGQTPCGDKIGSVNVASDDPSQELYWGMTGAMPIWLTFSQVEGKTPATIDMTFNCVMSGAEEDINWEFTIVEKTKDGKWVDGYYRSFKIVGDIK